MRGFNPRKVQKVWKNLLTSCGPFTAGRKAWIHYGMIQESYKRDWTCRARVFEKLIARVSLECCSVIITMYWVPDVTPGIGAGFSVEISFSWPVAENHLRNLEEPCLHFIGLAAYSFVAIHHSCVYVIFHVNPIHLLWHGVVNAVFYWVPIYLGVVIHVWEASL